MDWRDRLARRAAHPDGVMRMQAPWPVGENVWQFTTITVPLESRSSCYRRRARKPTTSTIRVTETYDGIIAEYVNQSLGRS